MPDSSDAGSNGRPIASRYKIAFYAAAWIAALFATNPNGSFWALAYMFPLGLAAFLNVRWGNDGGWGVLAACGAIYLVHGWFYFRSKSKLSTLLWFGLLVILLTCNVSGCHKMLPGH